MADDKNKYFIGIGLPEKEEKLILFVKQQFVETKGKTTPVHITLTEPFYIDNEKILLDDLENWAKKQFIFNVNIEGVKSFKQLTYATIFLSPVEKEELKNLQASIVKEIDYLPNRGNFEPHLTIANGVDFQNLETSVARLKIMGIKLKLIIDKVILYKMKGGSIWKKYKVFTLTREL